MTFFEYIAVLVSIIIGLGITNILSGVARLAQHPGRDRVFWIHLLWALYCFVLLIFFWWWEFALAEVEQWTFALYLFVVFYAVICYLLCALLFPSDLQGYDGFRDYFLSRRRWFFGVLALAFVVDFADTLLKGGAHLESLGWAYSFKTGLHVALCLVAMNTKKVWFHGTFVVLAFAYQLWFIFSAYGVVR